MTMEGLKNTQEGGFHIEDAKPEDVEAMRTMVRDAWLQIYPNEEHGITLEDLQGIDWFTEMDRRRQEITESTDKHTWVLRDDKGTVVGFCKATKISEIGEIDAMYVSSELQGKGLSKVLMQRAFDWIGPNLDIRLEVVKYNLRAISFYKKMGFKETTNGVKSRQTQLPSGRQIPRIEMMRKKLNEYE